MASISGNDLQSIIQNFDESDWEELHFKSDDLEINLSKSRSIRRVETARAAAAPQAAAIDIAAGAAPGHAQAAKAVDMASSAPRIADGLIAVKAPSLGTFYRSPKPGAPPYVEIGQEVSATTEICLVEVMKLFTAVTAGVSGIVREVLVEDGAVVEFDQPLVLLELKA